MENWLKGSLNHSLLGTYAPQLGPEDALEMEALWAGSSLAWRDTGDPFSAT